MSRIRVPLFFAVLLLSLHFWVHASEAEAPRAPECGDVGLHLENGTHFTISDGDPGADPIIVASSIVVSGQPPFIWDVDLTTFIRHTYSSDLDITLTSPAGTVVTISSDNGNDFANVFNGTVWDDDANPSGTIPHELGDNPGLVADASSHFVNLVTASPLVPEEPLGAFYGEDPNGIWLLTISDDTAMDGGDLDRWTLDLVTLPGAPNSTVHPAIVSDAVVAVPADGNSSAQSSVSVDNTTGHLCDVSVSIKLPHEYSADVQVTLTSPSGTVVTLTSGNGYRNVFTNTTFSNKADPLNPLPFLEDLFAGSYLPTDTTYTDDEVKTLLTPEESLSAFLGEDPSGTWILSAANMNSSESGSINGWSLNITTCKPLLDSDSDSYGDLCDGCPTDPLKIAQGQCGCNVPESVDSSGNVDCIDHCIEDPFKVTPGICGCGISDKDSDGDSQPNCLDACPSDSAKTTVGVCGCGVSDKDSDGDSQPNCLDACPSDSAKTTVGLCGCGTADTDSDGDLQPDCHDECSNDALKITAGVCGCGVQEIDTSSNGIIDCLFNDEVRARVVVLQSLVKGLRPVSNAKTKKALLEQKRSLNMLVEELLRFVRTNEPGLNLRTGASLDNAILPLRRAVKNAVRHPSLETRRQAKRVLMAVTRALS